MTIPDATAEQILILSDRAKDPAYIAPILLGSVVLHAVIFVGTLGRTKKWVLESEWWERAFPLQKNMMINMGFSAEDCSDDNFVLELFVHLIPSCCHHIIFSVWMIPVLVTGGKWGYTMFFYAALMATGYDLFDGTRQAICTFCRPSWFPYGKTPIMLFIMGTVLHHGLSISMIVPLTMFYLDFWAFHILSFSLLFAGAAAWGAGMYKFTINTKPASGLRQYKRIVVFQFVVIWVTRFFVWFPVFIIFLMRIYKDGNTVVFWMALISGSAMSFFNLAMLNDCTVAAIKWLPKKMPETEEEENELERMKSENQLLLTRVGTKTKLETKPGLDAELVKES